MRAQEIKISLIATVGLITLGGCEAPHGGRYNNASYDAPTYDADIYMPQYANEAYSHNFYHGPADIHEARPY